MKSLDLTGITLAVCAVSSWGAVLYAAIRLATGG
jgi:hypothetical protein